MNRLLYINQIVKTKSDVVLETLLTEMKDWQIEAPKLPLDSYDILDFLKRFCLEYHPDIIIGIGDGGFFAQQLLGYDRILVNPRSSIVQYMDEKDCNENDTYGIGLPTEAYQRHLKMEEKLFDSILDPHITDEGTCWCLFNGRTSTKSQDYRDYTKHYFPNVICYDDYEEVGHSTIEHILIPQIRNMVEMRKVVGVSKDNYTQRIARSYHERIQHKDFIVPNGVRQLSGMFRGNNTLKSVVLPPSIKQLEDGEFMGCSNLEKIVFPDGLEAIPDNCCKDCVNLTEIVLPDSVKEIGSHAISDTMIREVQLPASLIKLNDGAFDESVIIKMNTKILNQLKG